MEDMTVSYRCGECKHYMEIIDEEKKRILNIFKLYRCDVFHKLCNKDTPTDDCYKFKPIKSMENLNRAA